MSTWPNPTKGILRLFATWQTFLDLTSPIFFLSALGYLRGTLEIHFEHSSHPREETEEWEWYSFGLSFAFFSFFARIKNNYLLHLSGKFYYKVYLRIRTDRRCTSSQNRTQESTHSENSLNGTERIARLRKRKEVRVSVYPLIMAGTPRVCKRANDVSRWSTFNLTLERSWCSPQMEFSRIVFGSDTWWIFRVQLLTLHGRSSCFILSALKGYTASYFLRH